MTILELQSWFDANLPDLKVHIDKCDSAIRTSVALYLSTLKPEYEIHQTEGYSPEMIYYLLDVESSILKAIGLLTVQGSILGALINEIKEHVECPSSSHIKIEG
jgi:hypothetical protein